MKKFLSVICVVINILYPAVGEADIAKQFNAWNQCKGEVVGIEKLAEMVGGALFDCFEEEHKYCLFRCLGVKLKIFDSQNHLDHHQVDAYARLTNDFKEKKRFVDAGKECGRNKTIGTSEQCESMRRLIYCTRNKFVEICDVKGEKILDPNVASAEKADRTVA